MLVSDSEVGRDFPRKPFEPDGTVTQGDTAMTVDDPGDAWTGLMDKDADWVSGVSFPVVAKIDGWPNLLPDGLGLVVMNPGAETGLIDRDASSVSWESWPVEARMDGWPYLLPDDPGLVTEYPLPGK